MWHSDVNPNNNAKRFVAETTKKPIGTQLSHRKLKISKNNVGNLEKIIRTYDKKCVVNQEDDMPEIDVNAMIWEMFKSAIVNSVVHLGQDCQEDVRTNKSIDFEHVK